MSGWGWWASITVSAVSPHSRLITQPSWCRWPVPPPTSPRPPSSHSLSPLTLLLISCSHPFLLLQVCVMLPVSRLFSPSQQIQIRKRCIFFTDALMGASSNIESWCNLGYLVKSLANLGCGQINFLPISWSWAPLWWRYRVSLLIRSYKEEMAKNDGIFNG